MGRDNDLISNFIDLIYFISIFLVLTTVGIKSHNFAFALILRFLSLWGSLPFLAAFRYFFLILSMPKP